MIRSVTSIGRFGSREEARNTRKRFVREAAGAKKTLRQPRPNRWCATIPAVAGAPNTRYSAGSTFAFPTEGTYDFLPRINGADLLGRSDAQLVVLQLEESHLVLPGEKLVPRYVDLGYKLVSVDCEPSGVCKQ
jgi:hypothetical protein